MKILKKFDYSQIENSLNKIFPKILTEYQLYINDEKYDFSEIEFYYNDKKHKDCSVYKRVTKNGILFFHRYGIDISFDSNENHYGGILIRSLFKGNKHIYGPVNCKLEILNNIKNNRLIFEIKQKKPENSYPILKCKRQLGKTTKSEYKDTLYRYITNFINFNEKYKKEKFQENNIELIDLKTGKKT
jgi:hypothetical protein